MIVWPEVWHVLNAQTIVCEMNAYSSEGNAKRYETSADLSIA